eukprot:TRINITY_DN7213_c0_g2_i1.p1 TRINITY_DN7213_c0_g2~~TRINITY_DN7213_c0_g2_i1.p1  ORF type:complete len:298 (-),score=100.97 TRINITY_DN7213_c0_g2_i1:48-941(-)
MSGKEMRTSAFEAVENLIVSVVCIPVSGAIAQVHDVIDRRKRREEEEFEMEEMEMERIASLAEKQRKKREAKLKGLVSRRGKGEGEGDKDGKKKKRKKKRKGDDEDDDDDEPVDLNDLKPRMSIDQRRRLHRRKRRRFAKVHFYQHDEDDSGLELLGYIAGIVGINVLLLAYLYVVAPLVWNGLKGTTASVFALPFILFVCLVVMLAFVGVSRDNALDIRLDVERSKERIKYGNVRFYYVSYNSKTGEPMPRTFPMNNWANFLGVGGRMLSFFQMVCLVIGARSLPLPPYLNLQVGF